MVHQHFMLIPVFTVTENVMLGAEAMRSGWFPRPRQGRRAHPRDLRSATTWKWTRMLTSRDLPVGVQQRVEIIKLLYREADILIFDEPTAVLTPQEADELFEIMRALVKQGKSIIFITHKLREVLEVADHIPVIRRGEVVGEDRRPPKPTADSLAEMMVGAPVQPGGGETRGQSRGRGPGSAGPGGGGCPKADHGG